MAGKKVSESAAAVTLPFPVKVDGKYFVYAGTDKLYLSGSELLNQWPALEPNVLKVEDVSKDGSKVIFGGE